MIQISNVYIRTSLARSLTFDFVSRLGSSVKIHFSFGNSILRELSLDEIEIFIILNHSCQALVLIAKNAYLSKTLFSFRNDQI